MGERVNPETSLEVFGGEMVQVGDRVWDYDLDGKRIEGAVLHDNVTNDGEYHWQVHWDNDPENFDYIVLNPLQLHKIHEKAKV